LFIDRIYVNYSTPLTEFIANEFATVPSLVWESLLSDYEGGENAAETVLDIMATVEDIGVVGTVSSGTGSSYKVYMGGFNPAELITDVVQNQSKAITVAVQAQGSFSDPTPTAITVKVKDEEGTTITIDDSDITRLAETASFQIIKFTIPADDSDTLAPGYATIEIAFDDEKVQLSNAIRIIKKL
jgi:hypothetical protein